MWKEIDFAHDVKYVKYVKYYDYDVYDCSFFCSVITWICANYNASDGTRRTATKAPPLRLIHFHRLPKTTALRTAGAIGALLLS